MSTVVGNIIVNASLSSKQFMSDSSKLEGQSDKVGKNIAGKIGGGLKTIAKAGAAAFAAVGASAVAFGKQSIDAFNEANVAAQKFQASAANSKWSEAGTEELVNQQQELQKLGVVEGDAVAAGQAQLGTFQLSAEAIKNLTPAVADLAAWQANGAASGDQMAKMANLVGKVMTGNVGALSKYGVTLSDVQKKQLEDGNEMERSAVLAEVLANNFGGINEKLAQTPAGKITQLGNEFGDLQESVGALFTGQGSIEDVQAQLESFLKSVTSAIPTFLPVLVQGFTALVNGLAPQFPVIINTILPPLINAVILLLTALVNAFPQIIQGLMGALPAIISGVIQLVLAVAQALPEIVTALTDALPTIIPMLVEELTSPEFILAMVDAGVQLFMAIVQAVPKILGALAMAFGKLFSNLWTVIKKLASNIGSSIANVVGGVFKSIINSIIGFFEGFINTPIKAINAVIGVVDAIVPGNQSSWKIKEQKFGRLARGGAVFGPGTSTSDSIPTLLSNGEYVLRADAARAVGYRNLDMINETGMMPGNGGVTVNITINTQDVDIDAVMRDAAMAARKVFAV